MSSERAEQPAAPDHPSGVPGKTLATQREAMGWSVEQVADQLKLAVRQVVALEAGDYAHLPSPAVTRGFVRAYAKLMKLDPAPLVAQIEMDTPPTPDNSATVTRRASPTSFSASKFPSHGKRSTLPLGWIAGGAVVIVAAAAAWHFGLVPHREAAESTQAVAPAAVAAPDTSAAGTGAAAGTGVAAGASASGSAVETLQNPAVPLISVPGPNTAPAAGANAPAANAPAPAPATAAGKPPVQLATTATVPAAAPNAAPAATPATAAAPAAAGPNALVLNVREDSWIQVTPAKGGTPLISRLVKAGSTETVNVDGPVRVVVGNPGGVSATLRGNPVALPAVPGKTLSRINLQ